MNVNAILGRLLVIISPETDVNSRCKKTARYLKIRPVAYVSNPALLQAIVSKSDFLAVWLLSGAAKHWVPRGLWEKWHICCAHCGPLIVFLRYVFFYMIKSYARNSCFVHMKCFRFIFIKRAREKLVVRWWWLLIIHFTQSQGQSFLVSSPAVWTHTHTHFIFFFLCFWQ